MLSEQLSYWRAENPICAGSTSASEHTEGLFSSNDRRRALTLPLLHLPYPNTAVEGRVRYIYLF